MIFDTDPGIDDFFAMVVTNACDKFEIKAITPVAGNQLYARVSQNALNIKEYLGIPGYVARGAERPLIVPQQHAGSVHGESGLGPLALPKARGDFADVFAWDAIYNEAKAANGRLHVVAVGPLTNVAIALLKYPALKEMIRDVTIMGGSGTVGNHSAYGEFNIWADPHAAAIVFRSGLRIRMVGLEAIATCRLTPEMYAYCTDFDFHIKGAIETLYTFSTSRFKNADGTPVCPGIPDLVTVASIIDPDMMEFVECYVDVETQSSKSLGRTVCDFRGVWGKAPNAYVAVRADTDRYCKVLRDSFLYYQTH